MIAKPFGILFASAALVLAGCSTINPYTQEQQTSKAAKGAGIGAAVGAVLGAATGKDNTDRWQRALSGAGIGAVTGGGVGYYMDVQEAKLRQELANTGVSVTRDGDRIILNMPGSITFDSSSYSLRQDFPPVLASVARVLKEYRSTMIHISGHTDSTGSRDYNMLLSRQRAQSVADQLLAQGVESVRIQVEGAGPDYPIADNATSEGKARNRRVELVLLPYTQ